MRWANFLHIYQPPTQTAKILAKVTEESYKKLISGLLNNPRAKATININAILTELWAASGYHQLIDDIKTLMARGQLELTESAKYHPLLPKLPEEEIVRQIKLNRETNAKYFGGDYHPRGFFPPEMGFDDKVAKVVASMGYQWIIVDEFSYPYQANQIKRDQIYRDRGSGLILFFRERDMSFRILSAQLGTGQMLIDQLGNRLLENNYLLTAMDGETFGHHRLGLEQLLFDIYGDDRLPTVTISELISLFPQVTEVDPRPSTWALMDRDIERQAPFSRWDDSRNAIHRLQWQFTYLVLDSIKKADQSHPDYDKARKVVDQALHSDQYWWASARPWWSLEMIEGGAKELMEAANLIPGASEEVRQQAKQLYAQIIFTGFDWQRSGIVEELSRKEDEEIRARTDVGLPKIKSDELDKMISTLKKQMFAAAQNWEYERAAQFRNRIRELEQFKLGKED